MTPLKVKLDTEQVSKLIIAAIDKYCQYELNRRYCLIESDMDNQISFDIKCQMFQEMTEPDENNQSSVIEQWLSINRITFYYESDELIVENADEIYKAIEKHYKL